MKIYSCRLCKASLGEPKLKLPPTPLANEFLKKKEIQELFPLEICMCEACGHYQLNESIDPERLFRNYVYVAGTSSVNVDHFRNYATHIADTFNLKVGSKVLDIASNDGCLLRHFKNIGMQVLGIDPAENIAAEANTNGIETIPEFFTEQYAGIILQKYGQFDLITANNVFAHVPDLFDFAKGVKKILAPGGIFSFEVSYFLDVCEKTLFDTVYHEHSSYHTVKPLVNFFAEIGMELFGVEAIPNHGGSIRVFVSLPTFHTLEVPRWFSFFDREHEIDKKVIQLQKNIKLLGHKLREKLHELKIKGKSIAIYGVPAKATTLIYALGIDENMIDFAVDDAVLKQGTFTPGKHITVYHPDMIYKLKPDVLLILGWNFADSIMKNHSKFNGTWIVPLPELKEYNV